MDELPDLVLELISEYLNYNDLLNLRLTCKKLKKFIDQKEFHNLYLFYRQHPFCYVLFYTNGLICYPNSFTTNDLQILNSFKFKNNFNQLRKLIITDFKSSINLNELNHFTELIHLEIKDVYNLKGRLSLNHLRICFLYTYNIEEGFIFELDCPNLIALKLDLDEEPKLIGDTNNLKYLWMDVWKESNDYLFDFCSSLQNLSTICFSIPECLNHFLVLINNQKLNLPFLKRIEMNQIFFNLSEFNEDYFHNIVVSNLSFFMKNSSTKHIKFFMNNQLINLNEFNVIILELSQLDKKFFKSQIGYHELERFLRNSTALECLLPEISFLSIRENLELDEKMIKKMKKLFSITFEGKLEKTMFQLILRSCQRITCLSIDELNFKSSELDQLPKHFSNLHQLHFSKNCKIENFYFIGKFKNLSNLDLPQIQLRREVFTYILNNCSNLDYINICGILQHIILYTSLKTYSEKFQIRCSKNKLGKFKDYEFDTLNSLIDYYYENNLFESEFIE